VEPNNPYSKALDWIVEDDLMALSDSDPTLVQRFTAAYLYFATTRAQPWASCGPAAATTEDPINCVYKFQSPAAVLDVPGIRWLSESSECDWVGVSCNSLGEIFKIELCTLCSFYFRSV
jgi:hypothetical protein